MSTLSNNEKPSAVVGVVIYRDNGDIFLIKSRRWADKWLIPGGHIEFGEKMEDATRREVKEETGLDISNIEFFDVGEGIFPPEFHKKKHFIYLHFMAQARDNIIRLNDEAEEYLWIKPKEALELDLVESVRPLLQKYVALRKL